MKKIIKKVTILALGLFIATSAFGCGPKLNNYGGTKANQINISVYNSGYGMDWAYQLRDEFNNNQLKDTDYEIVIVDTTDLADTILKQVANNTNNYQAYINGGNELQEGIRKGYFEDLSDIVNSKVDGAEGKTIKEKILNYDAWEEVYKKDGQGIYALPFDDSYMGMIIDHQEFIENNWYLFAENNNDTTTKLANQGITFEVVNVEVDSEQVDRLVFKSSTSKVNYKNGDYILSAGKDGKFGTYDDGQPITLVEFADMIDRISATATPFIWGGAVCSYLDIIFNAIFAQYQGIEDYKKAFNFDTNGTDVNMYSLNGNNIELNQGSFSVQDGYKFRNMEGIKTAYEFFETYFDYSNSNQNNSYIHPAATKKTSQKDTQGKYLLGYLDTTENPNSAILIDGVWWECEAKQKFSVLPKGKQYGENEYRMLLLPDFVNQASDKSCFAVCEMGSISVPKDTNSERLSYTKEFIKFFLQNDSLRMIARTTGKVISYDIGLTEQDKNQMTPFQRVSYEIYEDKENIEIVPYKTAYISSPLTYASQLNEQTLLFPFINGKYIDSAVEACVNYDLKTILAGMSAQPTQATWNSYIQEAQQIGFFTGINLR